MWIKIYLFVWLGFIFMLKVVNMNLNKILFLVYIYSVEKLNRFFIGYNYRKYLVL